MYGGYFGAAQGVIMLALLGIALDDGVQRLNGVKNVLVAASNAAAAVVFILSTHVAWGAAAELLLGPRSGVRSVLISGVGSTRRCCERSSPSWAPAWRSS